jgi:hypothetical protein
VHGTGAVVCIEIDARSLFRGENGLSTPGRIARMATAKKKAPKSSMAQVAANIGQSVLDSVGEVPESTRRKSKDALDESRDAIRTAAAKASMTAGALALPPGPFGWLTILPELVAVRRIQAQMVADVAALHGQKATLTREHMMFCLFRHTAAQAVRDLAVRAGERLIVQQVTSQVLKKIATAIGVKLSRRVLGKGLTRWLPVVGVVGVAGYAYYDTAQVGATALEMFAKGKPAKA